MNVNCYLANKVARSARAWIETERNCLNLASNSVARSARAWIETHFHELELLVSGVARSARAWIETSITMIPATAIIIVARSARAWIETYWNTATGFATPTSHALRVRGLKQACPGQDILRSCRTLCACVD